MARGELLAEGSYHLSDHEGERGRESWQISRLGRGGVVISTRIDQTRPTVESWIVSYELTTRWAPRGLSIRLETDDHWMRSEQRANKEHWVARVDSAAGAQEFQLDFKPDTQVSFPSPLFHTVLFLRVGLAIGQARPVDLIEIQPGSLAPSAVHQSVGCLSEERIQVPAGSYSAIRYELASGDNPSTAPTQVWADSRGIILREIRPEQSEIRLARYRWLARR